MKSLAAIIVISFGTISVAQSKFKDGCYANCSCPGMSSDYLIKFNQDSTFDYHKRTGLSIDEAAGTYHIEGNIIKLNFEYVAPDSGYLYFTDSLNQMDSSLVQMPGLNLRMKRPTQLYLIKRKLFFYQPKNNREAYRSKFNLVRKEEQCLN